MSHLDITQQLIIVDLGALEFVAVIDVYRFPRGEEVDGAVALAVAVAGLLHPAAWKVHLGADGWRVDVGNASFKVANGGEGEVQVLGVESARQAVIDGVGDLNALLEGIELDEINNRPEDLFAGKAHLV